ncbi:apolipoprotein N-acyltransferase [Opitutaceae bacterium EW11]|nr:apolipoprotein N-acyltransferase [Opitutaceae bacterium EW11]
MATAAPVPDYDPYAEKPSFWKTNADSVWCVSVFVLTVLLTVLSFPPYAMPEFGYAFAVPAIFWAYLRPPFKRYAWTLLTAQAMAWTLMLGWLHHVTWVGLFLLGPFIGVWVGLWYLAVWWTVPRMLGRQTGLRIMAMFGLAGAWVLLEWTRMWFLTGFPWLPLAASQWQRSAVLQIASYTGAYGVSFILVAFNVGFAAYVHRLFREKQTGLRKRSPEFMWALMLLMFPTFYLILTESSNQQRQRLARVAVVQPAIPQVLKWDPSQSDMIFNVLGSYTATAAKTRPDFILWPEASTPYAFRDDDIRVQRWTEQLVAKCGVPLLMGSVSEKGPRGEEVWQNSAFVIDPVAGVQTKSYAKQHLVPFGEYVPLKWALGWLRKFAPIGDDATPGTDSSPLVVSTATGAIVVGPLICYEDIFPSLARRSALDGAETIAVLTNNAWYGEGGAAYQHAAHSVLRAVETRRPVIRCGNNGWSGWIDEFGKVREVMKNKNDSVYFRGTRTFDVTRDARWIGRQSFYTQHGDWFVLVAFAVAAFGFLAVRIGKPEEPQPEETTSSLNG